MKIGVADYGMNVWDGGLYDIESRLLSLRDIGLNGTERLEAATPADALSRTRIRMAMAFSIAKKNVLMSLM